MSNDIIDLEEIALNWVRSYPRDDDIEEPEASDLDWSKLRIRHAPAEYTEHVTNTTPSSHTISSCNFTNSTRQPQVFNLCSQRKTTSVCKISMTKGFSIGYSVNLRLRPPSPVIEANAGFKGELSVTDSNETTIEEDILWSVNSKVLVPSGARVKAELLLKEAEYVSNFKCKTKFDGRLIVKRRKKKKKQESGLNLEVSIRDIFRAQHGFEVDKTGIRFISKGSCKCKYGIEQYVKLSESPVTGHVIG